MHIHPKFRELVDDDDLISLEKSPNTIYAVWHDLTLAMTNGAWDRFARDNDADEAFFERWKLGNTIEDVLNTPTGEVVLARIEQALDEQRVQTVVYECSSPSIFRLMQVNIFPLGEDACLLSHALVRESTHAEAGRTPHPPDLARYTNEHDLLVLCSGCRRARVSGPGDDEERDWEWVPEFVAQPLPNVSHGLCAACKSYWMSPVATPTRF